jgi:DNA-binding protein H-NS
MTLERTTNQEGPALMTVYFDDATQPETPVAGTQTEPTTSSQQRVVTINMKHRHESEILSQLLALTNAVPVEPTPEEVEQLQQLAAQQEVSERYTNAHIVHLIIPLFDAINGKVTQVANKGISEDRPRSAANR